MIQRIALFFALLMPVIIYAQDVYQIKSHEVLIKGTSNLQSWSAEVEQLQGEFILSLEEGRIVEIETVQLSVDATSIKGSEGRRMDSKIYEALKTESHPEITFVLRDVLSLAENPGTARVTSRGVLTVAGVSRVTEVFTVGVVRPDGDIEFSGTHSIRMTDYRMKPPTAMFGALRTGDEVELKFTVILEKNNKNQ